MPSARCGRSPYSVFSVSCTPSVIALICRGFVPVQITKKSVKPPAFRRSGTTTSIAFLSSAARTAPATLFGNFGGVFFLVAAVVATLLVFKPLVFTMQVVYRSIQMVSEDMPCDGRGNEIVNRLAGGEPFANRRGGDVVRLRFHEKNAGGTIGDAFTARRAAHACPQLRRTRGRHPHRCAWPGDDYERAEAENGRK